MFDDIDQSTGSKNPPAISMHVQAQVHQQLGQGHEPHSYLPWASNDKGIVAEIVEVFKIEDCFYNPVWDHQEYRSDEYLAAPQWKERFYLDPRDDVMDDEGYV